MFRTKFLLFLALALFLGSFSQADQEYELSYLVLKSDSGRIIASEQAEKLRTPASVLKLVTSAAAIENVGLEHRYETSLWIDSHLHRGTVRGNLYLKGEADPELNLNSLNGLCEQLLATGVRQVTGDLVIDDGTYAEPPYGEGWAWDDAGATYQPEITGLALDEGVIQVDYKNPPTWLRIEDGDGGDSSLRLVPGREGVTVRGDLPQEITVPRSSLYTGSVLVQLLARSGIKVRGKVRLGQAKGKVVAIHRSRSLAQILQQALAVSDNFAMELVYRSAKKALPNALAAQRLRVVDGCGLSRYNLISCQQLVTVLKCYPQLKSLLPAGGEGTLTKRFLSGSAAGAVRAKTGTLGNISALAGYLYPDTPQECLFAIIINGSLDSTADRKAIEDDLVQGWAQQILSH